MGSGVRELFWPLLGNWIGSEEWAASPRAPAGSARAMMTFKLDVADSVVLQDYRRVQADGEEFNAHGVFMITPGTSDVLWWTFDSQGEPPEPAHGRWQDQELIMTKDTPFGRAEHRFAVMHDQLDHRIELQLGGADPAFLLAGHYRRVSGH